MLYFIKLISNVLNKYMIVSSDLTLSFIIFMFKYCFKEENDIKIRYRKYKLKNKI